MKVLNWRGRENECAQEYVSAKTNNVNTFDIFKEYNYSIDRVIRDCYGTLATAYDKISDVSGKIKAADAEIENLNAQHKKVSEDIQMAGHNKNANIQALIENKKLEFIRNSAVHSQEEIMKVREDADKTYSDYENVESLIDMESIRRRVLDNTGSAGEVSLATKGAIDYYGRTYGEFVNGKSNGWSSEFSRLYQGILESVKSDSTVIERVSSEMYTKNDILSKVKNSYKQNPYKVMKILLYMLCMPVAFYKYSYSEPNIIKCIKGVINDIRFGNRAPINIGLVVLWIAQWVFIASGTKPIKLIIYIILCLGVFLIFNISKKKITQVVKEFVEIEYSYSSVIGSIDDMVAEEFRKEKEIIGNEILSKYKKLDDMYNKMIADNKAAADEAEKLFDPNSIDKNDLEEEHRIFISKLQNKRKDIENSIEACKMNKAKMIEENKILLSKYDEAKDLVRSRLASDNNEGAFDINGNKYNFIFSQLDAHMILTNTKVINPLGMPISLTGKEINTVEDLSDVKSDMPPVTVPIRLREVTKADIRNICSAYNWYEFVYGELTTMMSEINDEVKRIVVSQEPSATNVDFSKFYKFDVLEHGLRCTVMFYNSKNDVNSHKTVANVCTHNIIHPAICTTDMRGLSFRIFPKDRTSFDSMDYSLGASIEERNSMISNHFYEVYDSSDRDKVLQELYSNALSLAKEIGSNSKNIIEYRAKKINGGSSPTRITYLIFTDDVNKYWTDTLRSILYGTGGTQTGGHDVYGENTYGIVPILFIDLAPLYDEKPDRSIAETIANIATSIPMDNFFYVGSGAETLKKYNRNEVLKIVESSINKSK